MATYHITSPDGGTYEVEAPDDASQDDVLSYAQKNMQPAAPAEKPSSTSPLDVVNTLLNPAKALVPAAENIPGDIYRGLTGAGVGTLQAADALTGGKLGDMVPGSRKAAAKVAGDFADQSKDASIADNLTADASNPYTWMAGLMKPAGLVKTALQGGGLGALIGGVAPVTGDDLSSQNSQRADNAETGATVGAVLPAATHTVAAAAPWLWDNIGEPIARHTPLVGNLFDTDAAMTKRVAGQLVKEGFTPAEVAAKSAAGDAAGATLPEATNSAALLGEQNKVATSATAGGKALREMADQRATGDIPDAIKSIAQPIAVLKKQGGAAYDKLFLDNATITPAKNAVLAPLQQQEAGIQQDIADLNRTTGWPQGMKEARLQQYQNQLADVQKQMTEAVYGKPIDTSHIEEGIQNELAKTNAADSIQSNAQSGALKALQDAQAKGGHIEALHDAKVAIDNLIKDAPNPGSQAIASGAVSGIQRNLLAAMDAASPEYAAARDLYTKGSTGQNILDTLNTTKPGDLNALHSKLFGTPEAQQDLQASMDPNQYAGFKALMDSVKDVSDSGLQSRAAASTGTGAQPPTKSGAIGAFMDWANSKLKAKDYEALANIYQHPDLARIGQMMQQKSVPVGQRNMAVKQFLTGVGSTMATAPRSAPGVPEPALPALSTPVAPEAPHAAMPGLISDAQASESTVPNSSLLQRIGKAESNNDPNAYNPASSAYGQYQITTPTWRGLVNKYGADYGITNADRNNPVANTIFAHLLTNENRAALRTGLGREPNDADIYAAHFLGAPTAVKFLSALNYNGPAARLAPAAAAANPKVFFRHGQPLTPAQVYQNMQHRIAS